MSELEGMPDTRTSLHGLTEEGHEAWLIRGIAGKLYRCPGCHGEIPIGAEHVVVHYLRRAGGSDHHHWHRRCAEELARARASWGQARARRPPRAGTASWRAAAGRRVVDGGSDLAPSA